MWFRKTESPEVEITAAGEEGAGGEEGGEGGKSTSEHKKNSVFKPPPERSKFEKFRRASFRRKSHTNQNGGGGGGSPAALNKDNVSVPRKRSKSPHSVLRSSFETPVEEEEDEPSAKVVTATSTKTTTAVAADSPDSKNKKQESTKRFNEDGVDVEGNDKSSYDDHYKNETINKNNKNYGVQKDDDDDKNVEHDEDKEGNGDDDEGDDDNDDDDNNDDDKDDDKDEGHNNNVDDVDHHKSHKKTYSPPFLLSYNKTIEENPVPVNMFNSKRNKSKQYTDDSSVVPSPPSLLPVISDPPITSKSYCKKPSLKALKTDPPKRKFYKSFTSRRQMSRIDASTGDGVAAQNGNGADDDDALPTHSKEKILLTDPKFRNNRIEKSSSKTKISELEKRESIKRSRSGRKLSAAAVAAASLPAAFANAANEEVNKSKNLQMMMKKKKNSNNNDKNSTNNKSTDSGDVGLSDDAAVAAAPSTKFSRARTYSNLNLAALVKFVVSNKKLLNTNDFALMRRKSISEAASSIITVAATCKPLPIALKYTQDGAVAEAPTSEDDAKTAKNVVLVKKQKLKNSFCDRLNNNNNINNNINNNGNNTNNVYNNNNNNINNNNINNNIINNNNVSNKKDNFNETDGLVRKKLILKSNINTNNNNNNKVKRNSSNSSKSSGNFEDEAFYSCDEQDLVDKLRNSVNGIEAATTATDEVGHSTSTSISSAATPSPTESSASTTFKRKSSSPSLTSRVAAKINETTNNYKNRKAAAAANKTAAKKQRKSLAVAAAAASASASGTINKRPEYYKQISVERLHSTSIVRQPSDRRPDTANASIRSNGNHSAAAASSQHNNSDLLHNSQASDASAGIISAADASVSSCGGSGVGGTSNAPGVGGADANAQDAADSSSRDSRKDRLQQQHQQNKSAPVSVNRSESYKERLSHKRSRNSRRKTSDPSLTSRPNDDQPDLGLSNSNYTASSNSSLSSGGGSDSPSTSMEQVATGAPGQHQQLQQQQQQPQQQQQLQQQYAAGGHQHQHHHHHHHHHQHSHQDSFHGSSGSGSTPNNSSFWGGSIGGAGGPTIGQLARQWQFESDEEDDLLMEADWSSNVAADILAAFTDAEKKRQEIINEIYQTERNHVRTLKLLERLFFCPLQDSGVLSMDHLLLLFPPALVALRELHGSFEQKLKQRRMEHNHVVNQVGDLLAGMFDGQSGDELCEYAAQFCARQQIALEALKEKRRKDETLQKILSKAESHKACRRLQLKDLLPTVLQRLTKYPLLFENLFKVTIRVVPDDVAEAEAIKRALESSKKILVDVNQAVKHAEDAHKLQNIQRKLDKSTFDKEEFKNLDLTQHRLIHDGSLTMKKNPGIQLHGLLFESMIVLLTKQDDKYSLKYLNATRISEVNNKPLSPIMNIDSETLVRQEAADKNSFFLIKTKTSQMLELRAPSSSECKTWFKHISDAAEQYKPRSKNASHEPVDDPAIATLPHSNTKESLEITPERPPPISATATMTTTPLAPMMMLPNNNSQHQQHHQQQHQQQQQQHLHHQHSADLRNGREGTPTAEVGLPGSCSIFAHPGAARNNRMNNNNSSELALSVNRTMSTRSCGESSSNNNNNYSDRSNQLAQNAAAANGVILRHTQSARQAAAAAEDATSTQGGGSGSKRDSTSIIYSNNSNNTRTLMQSSPPLVEPTAIQISISPAHTAEPVLTPAEKLRRLDAAIRDGLLEKQKIICDMFRLPIEHFHEIVDIASLPEAPKDSADIALATYAQVQSLTEVVNEYMKVTPEQEISAVSTSVCDQCHEKQRKQQQHSYTNTNSSNGNGNSNSNNNSVFRTPLAPMSSHMPTSRSTSSAMCAAAGASSAVQRARSPSPPPLPPPNKQQAQAQHKTATPSAKLQTHSIDAQIIHEDDDGYCEIDELRLPALPSMMPASMMAALLSKPAPAAAGAPPPLPPPAGTFKTPPPPPPPPATMKTTTQTTAAAVASGSATSAAEQTVLKSSSPELTKRQSTISAESIPEESADEVTKAMGDDGTGNDDDVRNKALLSSNPATAATTAEAAKSTETEKDEGEVDTALNKESMEGEISQPETTSSVGQTSSNQEQQQQESPQKQEPGDDQKMDDVTGDRKEDTPGQQSEEKKEQTQLEATAVAEITSNTSTSVTATVTAAATVTANENMTDHVVDNAEKENKNVIASAEPQNQKSAANVEECDTALSSEQNVKLNDASVETLAALNKLKTALIMVDSMSQTTLTGSVSGGPGIAANTPSYCGPSRILHATSLEPSVPCYALNSIVTALNAQISLLLPKINERDMERERLRKENQHLRELLNAMHERQRVEAKIETPKDITKSADDDANDEIDAPSKSNNNANVINTNNKTNTNINSKALSTPDGVATDSAASGEAAKSTSAAEK